MAATIAAIVSAIGSAAGAAGSAIGGAASAAGGALGSAASSVGGALGSAGSALAGTLGDTASSIGSAASSSGGGISSLLPKDVTGALSSLFGHSGAPALGGGGDMSVLSGALQQSPASAAESIAGSVSPSGLAGGLGHFGEGLSQFGHSAVDPMTLWNVGHQLSSGQTPGFGNFAAYYLHQQIANEINKKAGPFGQPLLNYFGNMAR